MHIRLRCLFSVIFIAWSPMLLGVESGVLLLPKDNALLREISSYGLNVGEHFTSFQDVCGLMHIGFDLQKAPVYSEQTHLERINWRPLEWPYFLVLGQEIDATGKRRFFDYPFEKLAQVFHWSTCICLDIFIMDDERLSGARAILALEDEDSPELKFFHLLRVYPTHPGELELVKIIMSPIYEYNYESFKGLFFPLLLADTSMIDSADSRSLEIALEHAQDIVQFILASNADNTDISSLTSMLDIARYLQAASSNCGIHSQIFDRIYRLFACAFQKSKAIKSLDAFGFGETFYFFTQDDFNTMVQALVAAPGIKDKAELLYHLIFKEKIDEEWLANSVVRNAARQIFNKRQLWRASHLKRRLEDGVMPPVTTVRRISENSYQLLDWPNRGTFEDWTRIN